VALQAHQDAARRREEERRAGELKSARKDPGRDALGAALHEEIERLPKRERLPLVLCDLERIPQTEAAARLHCSEATLRRRLAGARERLRLRLSRRGLAPSGGVLAALATARASAAIVPVAWIGATAQAATAGAGGVSAVAVVLANQ